jgi:hypothetical protein
MFISYYVLQVKHPGVIKVLEPMEETGGQVGNDCP